MDKEKVDYARFMLFREDERVFILHSKPPRMLVEVVADDFNVLWEDPGIRRDYFLKRMEKWYKNHV